MEEFAVRTPGEMEALGESFSQRLRGNEVLCLKGELGSGKTTFVRGLARGLGIKEGYQVRSPTFTIVNQYPTSKGYLIHIDLYRVRDFDYSEFIGQGILAIEWAKDSPHCNYLIEILIQNHHRVVRITKGGQMR